ncbi:ubiquitin-like-conjugating enzyme ATG10 isoform X2 [Mizuhopecten yessoensis]|uniref:ubiquitin-like-conjugating enzyme ATG10 isoform X2 n=1 Tax=Mizuhopecten yessoensis TaxID=6573 RepID=UPI000B4599C8|nr:ubiquitin-like-conjugating enzyme ATG10 isoform X2 [Mizuhopecten yessoensis]
MNDTLIDPQNEQNPLFIAPPTYTIPYIMAAGLISEDEFLNFTQHFLSLNFDKKEVYLYKRVSVVDKLRSCDQVCGSVPPDGVTKTHSQLTEDSDVVTTEEEEDSACLGSGADNPSSEISTTDTTVPVHLVYEYHIVYSRSYNVPVLYFNVYKPDGSMMSLTEVWDRVPGVYRDRLQQDRWTFLTQQEHPILGRPYFQLHPCHTADLMEQVVGLFPPGQHSNYIVSWLSAVGPVVGLDLPLNFAQMTMDDPP